MSARRARPVRLMCERCRRDRAACHPETRAWPDRKCDRCIRFGYDCGPNVPPPHRFPRATATEYSIHGPRMMLMCMYTLRSIVWEGTGCLPDELETEPHNFMFTLSLSYVQGMFQANNMVIYRLWERHNYCYALERFDEIYQRHLPTHLVTEAKEIAFDEYVSEIQQKQIRGGAEMTSRAIIESAAKKILKRGVRWRALIDAVESEEILLLDQDAPFLGDVTLGMVLFDRSDDDFGRAKEFLLLPENGLKSLCLRLSGVSQMLKDLSDTGLNNPVRDYLEKEIKRRIENAIQQAENAIESPSEVTLDQLLDRDIVEIFGIQIRFMKEPFPDDPPVDRPQATEQMELDQRGGPSDDVMTPPSRFNQEDLATLLESDLFNAALSSPAWRV